jgi:alpha-ribazole phosphatase
MPRMIVTRWWWIRHAPVTGTEGRIYGRRDVDCDLSNDAALRLLAARLPDDAVWIATPLARTQRTAAAIATRITAADRPPPAAPLIEAAFIEQDFGDWQGRSYREIDAAAHRFWLAPAATAPPGGESFATVMARVGTALAARAALHAGRDIVAVAHGGSIRAAVAHALGLAPEAALALSVDTLSLTRLDHIAGPGAGQDWRVAQLNWPAA